MDTNNRNTPGYHYNNTYNKTDVNNEENMYSINQFNNRRYEPDRYDRRYDRREDRRYDRRYDRYPYCDRYGRCDNNSLWWMFWPFFFF